MSYGKVKKSPEQSGERKRRMGMAKIRVVMCPADRAPYVTYVSDTLENMQRIVDGYIETYTITTDAVIICNEEGRLRDLPRCKSLCFDSFCGDCFIAGVKGEEFTDLSEDAAAFWLKECKKKWKENGGAIAESK